MSDHTRRLPIVSHGGEPVDRAARSGGDEARDAARDEDRQLEQSAAPLGDPGGTEHPDRREFFGIAGASLALAGLAGCGRGPLRDDIEPYVHEPEDVVPGRASSYATSVPAGAAETGVLVTTHMARPTKIEGNELHPASDGATDAVTQAILLSLYDPDRSATLFRDGGATTWRRVLADMRAALARHEADGTGLRLLTGAVPSPSIAETYDRFLGRFPGSMWHAHDPLAPTRARAGIEQAFGTIGDLHYRLDEARVVAAFDSDFLMEGAGAVRYARDFAQGRRRGAADMLRLYAAEPMPTVTGSVADHRLPLRSGDVGRTMLALAAELGVARSGPGDETEREASWVRALARDLEDSPGRSLVAVGERQPVSVHALAMAINDHLQNVGRTLIITEPVDESAGAGTLSELAADIEAGDVQTLLIAGTNPVATAPADLAIGDRIEAVDVSFHLGLYRDETARRCRYHVPEAHPLERWGDGRAFDGTLSLRQPVIRPIDGGRSPLDVVAALTPDAVDVAGEGPGADRERLRAYWRGHPAFAADFDATWRRTLHDGVVPASALPPMSVTLRDDALSGSRGELEGARQQGGDEGDLELAFALHPRVLDGRYANNEWLQELPTPITNLTWDNPAMVGPTTAERLGIRSGDEVRIRSGQAEVLAPAWVIPGHAEGAMTLHLGYGRELGRVAEGRGFSAEALRSSEALWRAAGQAQATGRTWTIASTQHHHQMEGRDLIREASAEAYERDAEIFARPIPDLSLYPDWEYPAEKWAMVIDLNSCIGCGACMVACQAENNIPVVGKEEVVNAREMHWIRVDTYYTGDDDDPEFRHQPVPCMHCERAPCELVCPVQATVHSTDGLNDMVYNRCVGTRYCSNNCPYKVRRFNFFDYARRDEAHLDPGRNPEVTVRTRGVMEKCTYCVQRISLARIEAKNEQRPIRDGEVVTACQQVCPADAIVFGDGNDPDARVTEVRQSPRNYGLLEELNTRPRTTYLAKLTNPGPERGSGR